MYQLMKKILNLLLLCLLTSLLPACGGSDTPQSPNSHRGQERRCLVDLSLGGDFVEQSDLPLSRAEGDEVPPKTYVGVYVRTKKVVTDSWQYYAYGLFDDQSKMQLEMTAGYYYEFYATTLTNSTDVYEMEPNGSEHQMYRPFICDNENGVQNTPFNADNMNKFIYSNRAWFRYLYLGTASVKIPGATTSQNYRYPRVHRYYGTKAGFQFSSEMEEIEIPVKKKNFGLQINVIGLPEGTSLSWKHANPGTSSTEEGYSQLLFSKNSFSAANGEQQSWEDIYSLYNLYSAPTEKFEIEFTWNRTPSVREYHTVTFTPAFNVMKALTIDFTKQASAEGVNISVKQEEAAMTTDEEEIIWE